MIIRQGGNNFMAKAIFSVDRRKIHTVSQFNFRYNHNLRVKGCDNADPNKSHLNADLIPLQHDTYTQAFNARMKELGCKVRKNAVRGVEILLTYGSKNIPEDFDLEHWKQENVEFLKETFGEKNIINAVLHMDETVPHIHAIVVPELDGRLNAKVLFDGKHLEKYQEDYANRMHEECGLEKRIKYSRARHEDIRKFYSAINDAVIERLPAPEKDESIDDYFARANEVLVRKNLQNLAAMKKMEQAIVDAKNDEMQMGLENAKLSADFEELKRMMGDNIQEMKKKIKMTEFLNYSMKNYPDKEYIKTASSVIQTLIDYAKEHQEEIDMAF